MSTALILSLLAVFISLLVVVMGVRSSSRGKSDPQPPYSDTQDEDPGA